MFSQPWLPAYHPWRIFLYSICPLYTYSTVQCSISMNSQNVFSAMNFSWQMCAGVKLREREDDKINRLEIAPFGGFHSSHVTTSTASDWPNAKCPRQSTPASFRGKKVFSFFSLFCRDIMFYRRRVLSTLSSTHRRSNLFLLEMFYFFVSLPFHFRRHFENKK